MVIAGLCGGLDRAGENRFGVTHYAFHDAACALLEDGEVTAAIEEERLNRIKHTNTCPLGALRHCLARRRLTLADLDAVAFGVSESYLDATLSHRYALAPTIGRQRGRQFLQDLLADEFGHRLDPRRFHFVDHHTAHACSAYYPSGFDDALVVTLDGVGDGVSGAVYAAAGDRLDLLCTYPEEESLGFFYVHVTRYLGFDLFDEYKVMGLAPYGDEARFAPMFRELYELLPEGRYRFDRERLRQLWDRLPPRPVSTDFPQSARDVAQAGQRTLQQIVTHILEHFQRTTGMRHLCLAGGVALNCTMNGALLRQGLFRDIFVQPAAHDAGLSLGAALHVHHAPRAPVSGSPRSVPRRRLRQVYWGGECGSPREIVRLLRRWDGFLTAERVDDPYAAAAGLMSEGAVIGWARGRSEFGPRALGNRSILADPRPAAHKDLINALVKKREAFRPFAPSVLEEYAAEFFELPEGCRSLPFMLFTAPVRERYRATLGAVTHIDGSARLQTVSRHDNPCYWRLIDAFRERTGVPVVLNTSFNNYAEPIVETAADTIVCLLTTGLTVLVLEDWIVRKRPRAADALRSLTLRLPRYVKLHDGAEPPDATPIPRVGTTYDRREYAIPGELFPLLLAADGCRSIGELMDEANPCEEAARVRCTAAIEELWERRLVVLNPA